MLSDSAIHWISHYPVDSAIQLGPGSYTITDPRFSWKRLVARRSKRLAQARSRCPENRKNSRLPYNRTKHFRVINLAFFFKESRSKIVLLANVTHFRTFAYAPDYSLIQ